METFLEFLREDLEGIVREVSGYFFWKRLVENKKTSNLTVEVAGRRGRCTSLFCCANFALFRRIDRFSGKVDRFFMDEGSGVLFFMEKVPNVAIFL
jgi:hypothetical protein